MGVVSPGPTVAERMAALRAAHPEPLVSSVDDPAPIGPGWSVWEQAPAGTDYNPRGGVVVGVDHHSPDPDTGEIGDRYLLVRTRYGKLSFLSLRASQVAPADRPNAATIRGVCQVAARELAAERRRADDARDLELWSLGVRLMAVIVPAGAGSR